MSSTASSVTKAVSQPFCQFDHTLGARLKPMIATMAPLTTGGMMMSIHFAPAKWTATPTRASSRPVTMMPKLAAGMPLPAEATAAIGAMNPNDDPR